MPGPTNVIEEDIENVPDVIVEPLLVGFVGKKEQTGYWAQKPENAYERLYKMVADQGDLVFDPMCGSNTTGAVARKIGINSIISDGPEEYAKLVERRSGIKRLPLTVEVSRLRALEIAAYLPRREYPWLNRRQPRALPEHG